MPPRAGATGRNPTEAVRALLESPDTFGTVILVLVLDLWGDECLRAADDPDRGPWHPTVFKDELEHRYGVVLPKCNLDKLMAAVTVITTDLFFQDARAFVTLANVLAGDEFDPGVWEKADAVECAWAITEALLLDPPDDGNPEPFCDEIRHYVGAVLRDEGFVSPPDVLRIALDGDFASQVEYNFADDPAMFEGIYAVQQGKAADVESVLRSQLTELAAQLKALPLADGDTAELEKRIAQMLKLNEPEEATGPEGVL